MQTIAATRYAPCRIASAGASAQIDTMPTADSRNTAASTGQLVAIASCFHNLFIYTYNFATIARSGLLGGQISSIISSFAGTPAFAGISVEKILVLAADCSVKRTTRDMGDIDDCLVSTTIACVSGASRHTRSTC